MSKIHQASINQQAEHAEISAQLAKKALCKKSRRNRRILREKRQKAANFAKEHKKDVGAAAYRATVSGFTKRNKLPHHFGELFNNARIFVYSQKEYVDQKGVTRTLSTRGQRKLFEILIVFLSSCDFLSGQVGLPKIKHMDTISHDAFMLQHAKRFGYAMSSSTWYRYVDILKSLGAFSSEPIHHFFDTEGVKKVRSESSYKWLSKKFLVRLGVFKDHIRASIKLAYTKARDKGLSFVWKMKNEQDFNHNIEFNFSSSTIPPDIPLS